MLLNRTCVFIVLFCVLKAYAQKNWLVECKTSKDCAHLKNANCNQTAGGYCYCGETSKFFCEEIASDIIVNEIGNKCGNSQHCAVENSFCDGNKKCSCSDGFRESRDLRQCLKTVKRLGDSCLEDSQCVAILNAICSDNKCICQNKAKEYNGECLNPVSLGESCSDNLECVIDSSSCINFTCSCNSGFAASKGRCLPFARKIKDECIDDVQCLNVFGKESKCLDDICQCKRFFHYNETFRKCVKDVLLNEVCQNHDECHQPGQDSSRLMCIEGQCKCKVGYKEEGNYCRDPTSSAPLPIYPHLLMGLLAIFIIHGF